MSEKCPDCQVPMFHYKVKHNGVDKVISRCMMYHGTPDHFGRVKKGPYNKRLKQGVKEHFVSLIKLRD